MSSAHSSPAHERHLSPARSVASTAASKFTTTTEVARAGQYLQQRFENGPQDKAAQKQSGVEALIAFLDGEAESNAEPRQLDEAEVEVDEVCTSVNTGMLMRADEECRQQCIKWSQERMKQSTSDHRKTTMSPLTPRESARRQRV